eukprot:g32278.t1
MAARRKLFTFEAAELATDRHSKVEKLRSQALHSLIFMLFLLSLPFCFQARVVRRGAVLLLAFWSLQVMPPKVQEDVPRLERPDIACLGECPPEVEEKARTAPQHCAETDRISLVSFLVALIGGGVFSLEAFEAFPML